MTKILQWKEVVTKITLWIHKFWINGSKCAFHIFHKRLCLKLKHRHFLGVLTNITAWDKAGEAFLSLLKYVNIWFLCLVTSNDCTTVHLMTSLMFRLVREKSPQLSWVETYYLDMNEMRVVSEGNIQKAGKVKILCDIVSMEVPACWLPPCTLHNNRHFDWPPENLNCLDWDLN